MGNSVLEARGEVNHLLKVCNCVIGEVQRVRDEAREHNYSHPPANDTPPPNDTLL